MRGIPAAAHIPDMPIKRVHSGAPAGGQFAVHSHTEAAIELSGDSFSPGERVTITDPQTASRGKSGTILATTTFNDQRTVIDLDNGERIWVDGPGFEREVIAVVVDPRIAAVKSIAADANAYLAHGPDPEGGYDQVKADDNGTLRFFRSGKLHNAMGPAVESLDGDQEFRLDGKLDNPYGPTIVRAGGQLAWHRAGKKIRTPAPAEQIVGFLKGAHAGVFDIQWARHQAAKHLGGHLGYVDAQYRQLDEWSDQSLIDLAEHYIQTAKDAAEHERSLLAKPYGGRLT